MRAMQDRRGSVITLMLCIYAALLVFLAMGIDAGRGIARKTQLVNACDAAALAAGRELPNTTKATAAANQVLAATFSSNIYAVSTSSSQITVSATDSVATSFARVAGLNSITVSASARVDRQATPINEMPGGITPWAIENSTYSAGQPITLKLSGGSGQNGNFYALALGGTGGSNYLDNIKYGYSGTLGTGDDLFTDTEPGAKTGPTKDGVDYRISLATSNPTYASETSTSFSSSNPRILICPMVNSWVDVAGRSVVEIVGFAAIYLEGMSGNNVSGRFVAVAEPNGVISSSRPTANDYGVFDVRLTQ